ASVVALPPRLALGALRLRVSRDSPVLRIVSRLRDCSRGRSSICDTFVTRSMMILRPITRVLRNSLLLIAPCPPRNKEAWCDAVFTPPVGCELKCHPQLLPCGHEPHARANS